MPNLLFKFTFFISVLFRSNFLRMIVPEDNALKGLVGLMGFLVCWVVCLL